jgi:hypothetical protein
MLDKLKAIPGKLKSYDWIGNFLALAKKPAVMIAGGIFMVLVLCAAVYGIWYSQQPPKQPIQFNHSLHLGFGVQCLYCHPGAWKDPSPGIPTETKCWGCHQQIAIKDANQQKLADAVKNNEPIKWVPVFIVPDFVHYNHRPHIAYGLNCETCHGELSRMTVAEPPKRLDMGWCLHCHRTIAADDPVLLTKLEDCGTCHY